MFKVKFMKSDPEAIIPKRGSEQAAAYDLYALKEVTIPQAETAIVPTGIYMSMECDAPGVIPCMEVRPRSGNSLKTKIRIANAPGTIDADYRGEVGILVHNVGSKPLVIEKGSRPAQAVFSLAYIPEIEIVDNLKDEATERGTGGFGSTGE